MAAVVPDDESDESSAILEVRPGAGGREAALFTGELFQMYLRSADNKSNLSSCILREISQCMVILVNRNFNALN